MPNQTKKWFKSNPTAVGTEAKFDREAGTIKDVVLCRVGPAKGHGVWLEQSFIEDVANYGKTNHETHGLKSRFGHPAMSDTTMGTQLGFYKNFRIRGEEAIADYQVLEAAKNSKNGNMWEWLFDMAEEKPDHVMNSIVFSPAGQYQIDDKGKKRWTWVSKVGRKKGLNSDPDWNYDPNKKTYVALGDLYFADMVEQGAATESLFSAQFNQDKFAVMAHEFLNEHTGLDNFLKENPTEALQFLKDRGVDIKSEGWFSTLKGLFGGNDERIKELETQVTAANTKKLNLQTTINELAEASAVKDAEIKALQEQLATATARITELENMPLVEDKTKFKKETGKKQRKLLPIEQEAKRIYEKYNS